MSQPTTANTAAEQGIITRQAPPRTALGILARLGPGLIIAASIVGSGELIATTKTGAEAGFWLLWLIIVGCVIKVFVQVEFGRFTITEGRTALEGMNLVPGPRLGVNWLVWYWVLMFSMGLGQLGGIVGGVGQSLALSVPLTGDLFRLVEQQDQQASYDRQAAALLDEAAQGAGLDSAAALDAAARTLADRDVLAQLGERPVIPPELSYTYDDVYWSGLVVAITCVLLINGRYRLVQNVATVLVAAFTAVTIFNLAALGSHEAWAIRWSDLADGLSFRLPPASASVGSPVATALATFGIIGVGASELVAYPYWCLEKGYARFTGPRDASPQWAETALGWLRVMRWDAWCSMVIYTFATVAFYLLGASVLHRAGLNPGGNQMLYVLAQMYRPVFGTWAGPVFLFGAFAVLYSTFFVATAGNARMAADALRVFRWRDASEAGRLRWVRRFCGLFPILSFSIYVVTKDPVRLVLVSGLAQSIMLPMLGGAALYFRFRRCDPRICPGRLWDVLLAVSVAGLVVTGSWGVLSAVQKVTG